MKRHLARSKMRVLVNRSLRKLGAYFDTLVHESVREDVIGAARQRSFIAAQLLAGLLALCVLPVYLSLTGRPTALDAVAFLWFLLPLGVAAFLSRTGKIGVAHLISSANFTGLIAFSAWLTGGLTSFLIPWIVVVPLEAALSADGRVVAWAGGLASLGLITLTIGGALGLVPPEPLLPVSANLLGLFGAMSAVIYAAGLAIAIQLVHRRLGRCAPRRRGALPAACRERDRHDHPA